jgi:hypothetical protein
MSYDEIFIYGWSLNLLMFITNLMMAINVMKSTEITDVAKEHAVLSELKIELDKYYPNRGFETLISYFIPFTAFFRVGWRLIEMNMFFKKNDGAKMYDFMVYRYEKDIQIAKAKVN